MAHSESVQEALSARFWAVRDLLGHTQISTTDVYLHSIPLEHVEAMRRMDGLLGARNRAPHTHQA